MSRAKPENIMLRVSKNCLEPADEFARARLKEKGYRVGDYVSAQLRKPRNPGFHRLAHQLGALLAQNLDDFEGVPAHTVLKRIQLEADIACDEMWLNMPGVGPVVYRIPQSLSFESMDQGEFEEVFRAMCRYVAKRYWPSMTAEQIEATASCMTEAA